MKLSLYFAFNVDECANGSAWTRQHCLNILQTVGTHTMIHTNMHAVSWAGQLQQLTIQWRTTKKPVGIIRNKEEDIGE